MPSTQSSPPKPRSELNSPEITRLPNLANWRRFYRRVVNGLLRLLALVCVRCKVTGLENFPHDQAALLVTNHLGDADMILGMAFTPAPVEVISKAELYEYPILGRLMDWYGVIWVHRGQPDRRALRAVLDGLSQGRVVAIAPEGRESETGGLEEGTGGAAYLALKANVPILPVTYTGTENEIIFKNLKRLRRSDVSITIGPLFRLDSDPDRREAVHRGTQKIMFTLSSQLPEKYRGVYGAAQIEEGDRMPARVEGKE
jgi:1-acyl-sn-glycerol-3-phosphate acyltransferase